MPSWNLVRAPSASISAEIRQPTSGHGVVLESAGEQRQRARVDLLLVGVGDRHGLLPQQAEHLDEVVQRQRRPAVDGLGWALLLVLLGCAAFGALGILVGGTLRAEITLAVANLIWLVLVFVGGIVVPVDEMPRALAAVLFVVTQS